MELDSLKEIWKQSGVKEPAASASDEIVAMLNKSSRSPIARMKRNVLAEVILLIVLFGSAAIFYFIAFNGRFSSIAWVYISIAAVCSFYYYCKWKLLDNMQCLICQVKSNLTRQVKMLDKYIYFYTLFSTILTPLVFIFLGVLFYFKFPEGSFKPVFPPRAEITMTTWLGWLGALALLTIIAWVAYRWYVKRLYGQHIQQLKRLVAQLEE